MFVPLLVDVGLPYPLETVGVRIGSVGTAVGVAPGVLVGATVGGVPGVGVCVGATVGTGVNVSVGVTPGVGVFVGTWVGVTLGVGDGAVVGRGVGVAVVFTGVWFVPPEALPVPVEPPEELFLPLPLAICVLRTAGVLLAFGLNKQGFAVAVAVGLFSTVELAAGSGRCN